MKEETNELLIWEKVLILPLYLKSIKFNHSLNNDDWENWDHCIKKINLKRSLNTNFIFEHKINSKERKMEFNQINKNIIIGKI